MEINQALVEVTSNILVTLIVALLSILAAKVTNAMSKNKVTKDAAEQIPTILSIVSGIVMQLQQESVSSYKENGGKLTKEQITNLAELTYDRTKTALGEPIVKMIEDAGMDLSTIISAFQEEAVLKIKGNEPNFATIEFAEGIPFKEEKDAN